MPAETVEPRFEIRQLISDSMNLCWKKSRPGIDLNISGHRYRLVGAELSNSMPSFNLLEFNLEGDEDDGIAPHVHGISLAFYVKVVGDQRSVKIQTYYKVGRKSLGAIAVAERNQTETLPVTPHLEPAVVAVAGLNQITQSLRRDIHLMLDPGAALRHRAQ